MIELNKKYISELEARFGTEEALGICFEDETGNRYSLEEGITSWE